MAATPAAPDSGDMPARSEVVVIGSGYTGLSAALVLARAGREVVILEAGEAGAGCSTRNGGQVAMGIKPDLHQLARRHGEERARAMLREGHNALAFLRTFVAEERIDCDWRDCGRFSGAYGPRAYERMARKIGTQPRGLEVEAHVVPRAEQASEIGSDFYHGGVVYRSHASVDPARLHRGLLARAIGAGVRIVPHCPALTVEGKTGGFRVATARGQVAARDVLVATNGYSSAPIGGLRRRVIPIGSYIIATEELPPDVAQELIPRERMVTDSRHVVFYFRLSPDRRRLLFGGRVALFESDDRVTAPRLHREMCRIFPQLAKVRVSHAWHGKVALTFDDMPHLGQRDGLYYAMGYCGSGISMACWLGNRIALHMLGRREGATALDGLPFPMRPLYDGRPWFLAPAILYYKTRDALGL